MKFRNETIIEAVAYIDKARTIFNLVKYGDQVDVHELADRIIETNNYRPTSAKKIHTHLRTQGIGNGIVTFDHTYAAPLCSSLCRCMNGRDPEINVCMCANAMALYLSPETISSIRGLPALERFIGSLSDLMPAHGLDPDIKNQTLALIREAEMRKAIVLENVTEQLSAV